MLSLFQLRAPLTTQQYNYWSGLGISLILGLWLAITELGLVSHYILPSPLTVLAVIPDMHLNDALLRNAGYSIYLNFTGYFFACLVSIPLGFIIGLYSPIRAALSNLIGSFRFLPLTAVLGLFILNFGIGDVMKISFLAFGIFLYLLPAIIRFVMDVEQVLVEAVQTLGATSWQTIRTVFIPTVISRSFPAIRDIVAISWTYIIIAEVVNKTGGLGAMIATYGHQSNMPKIFATLLIIILIGFIQDLFFSWLDKLFFPYKYVAQQKQK